MKEETVWERMASTLEAIKKAGKQLTEEVKRDGGEEGHE